MKTIEITIKPISGFGTPMKGDTIFGHICWQAAYDSSLFGGRTIDQLLSDYETNPFLIISSAFFKVGNNEKTIRVLKRPDIPLPSLFDFQGKSKKEIIRMRKVLKSKRWMKIPDGGRIESLKKIDYISDSELVEESILSSTEKGQLEARKKGAKSIVAEFSQPHNTINRLTNTTGEGRFAPFVSDQSVFLGQIELILYVGLREDISIEQTRVALQRIGETGFGKDASTGLGKFNVISAEEFSLSSLGSDTPNACYVLAPSVPEKNTFLQMYFAPFTRFGRHGDVLAKSSNPFKNPVIMADEGAIFMPADLDRTMNKPYIGTAVTNISKAEPNAVTQGYSLYIPVIVEA